MKLVKFLTWNRVCILCLKNTFLNVTFQLSDVEWCLYFVLEKYVLKWNLSFFWLGIQNVFCVRKILVQMKFDNCLTWNSGCFLCFKNTSSNETCSRNEVFSDLSDTPKKKLESQNIFFSRSETHLLEIWKNNITLRWSNWVKKLRLCSRTKSDRLFSDLVKIKRKFLECGKKQFSFAWWISLQDTMA